MYHRTIVVNTKCTLIEREQDRQFSWQLWIAMHTSVHQRALIATGETTIDRREIRWHTLERNEKKRGGERNEGKRRARQSRSGDDSLCRRRRPARACRIRARCICNEGCAPPIAATSRARCIKPPGCCIGQSRRLSRSRSRSCARARYLSSPGHWNAIPRADDLYLANARPRGRMSHVPSLCLYRPSRKYPAAREERENERANERSLTRTRRIGDERHQSTLIIHWGTIKGFLYYASTIYPTQLKIYLFM